MIAQWMTIQAVFLNKNMDQNVSNVQLQMGIEAAMVAYMEYNIKATQSG